MVNLERPLRADARLGGHFVQGHVDATGAIEEIRPDGDSYWLTVKFPPLLAPYIVRKGSIAVDGISLTVAGVDDRHCDVQIIPFTWEHTNLHLAKRGEPREPRMRHPRQVRRPRRDWPDDAAKLESRTRVGLIRSDASMRHARTIAAEVAVRVDRDAVEAIRDGAHDHRRRRRGSRERRAT